MTCRGGKEALEKPSGVGKNERQPVTARLVARWRRSNLVILVTFKKKKHPGEVYVRKGSKKRFIQIKEGPLRRAP